MRIVQVPPFSGDHLCPATGPARRCRASARYRHLSHTITKTMIPSMETLLTLYVSTLNPQAKEPISEVNKIARLQVAIPIIMAIYALCSGIVGPFEDPRLLLRLLPSILDPKPLLWLYALCFGMQCNCMECFGGLHFSCEVVGSPSLWTDVAVGLTKWGGI